MMEMLLTGGIRKNPHFTARLAQITLTGRRPLCT